jgi:hypothetical protein
MAICDNMVFNNEILINEAHTNKYIFVLSEIPTSYLLSKFTESDVQKLVLAMDDAGLQELKKEVIMERNKDLKNFLLYVQSIDMPDINVGYSTNATMFVDLKHVDGKIQFSDLTMNVMNDENWFIYRMLYYWLLAAHNPEETMKFKEREYYNKFYVRGTLIILDNHYEKVLELEFTDLHPISIGQVNLKDSDAEKIIIPVTWVHAGMVPSDRYVIKKV